MMMAIICDDVDNDRLEAACLVPCCFMPVYALCLRRDGGFEEAEAKAGIFHFECSRFSVHRPFG